ncbi:MAG: hypothetical protein QM667_12805 [Asticcacaulis sp.]
MPLRHWFIAILTMLALPAHASEAEWMNAAINQPMKELYQNARAGKPDAALIYAMALTLGRDASELIDNEAARRTFDDTVAVHIFSLKALRAMPEVSSVDMAAEDKWLSEQLRGHVDFSDGVIIGYGNPNPDQKASASERLKYTPVLSAHYWWLAAELAGKDNRGNYVRANIQLRRHDFGGHSPANTTAYYPQVVVENAQLCATKVGLATLRNRQRQSLATYVAAQHLSDLSEDTLRSQLIQLAESGVRPEITGCESDAAFQKYKTAMARQSRTVKVKIVLDLTPEDIRANSALSPPDRPPSGY